MNLAQVDIVFLAEKKGEMKTMMVRLERCLRKKDLELNVEKTKIMKCMRSEASFTSYTRIKKIQWKWKEKGMEKVGVATTMFWNCRSRPEILEWPVQQGYADSAVSLCAYRTLPVIQGVPYLMTHPGDIGSFNYFEQKSPIPFFNLGVYLREINV
ncbi:hypothetical protein PUN28_019766 [Cardiocondyla obscurior]|uniref:Reverse transcriptase domain-containing protein n=1 Tax=Cardiocondyla obscurior TaxID=286306 RepID=A0AAW2EB34_9HYME